MNSLVERQLKLAFLPISRPVSRHAALYRLAAETWEDVWLRLYDEHRVEQPLFLDGLLRQDEAACIFLPDRCVAMILFRVVDFSVLNYSRDSYFKEWVEQDIQQLLAQGPRVFMTTYLTVHPEFRKFSPDFKFKELLLNIMIKRFVESDADVISGITRRDRGIHDESYKLGASLVHQNVDYMDGRFKVDLVAFYRADVQESQNPKVREITDRMWAKRLDLNPSIVKIKAA